ncbi:MAG: L-2-amino-thiazoline-4-carboxylic acid hydrolase [Erysipelotrichaceae bacterium]|nr:L-2-amino-thiazoline-4-carboxylic acid hydrolase [Erysipelotrichaceae bacterium]
MKYIGMPAGMWLLFRNSFRNNLTAVLGFSKSEAAEITEKALSEYKRIIGRLPEFEKGDRFKMNIISCATLCAFILSMPEKPEPDKMTDYYREAMMTGAMKWFCKTKGKDKFTDKDLAGMKHNEQMQAADRNPYSWNMAYLPYPDGSGYEARFYKCGICTLMRELGLDKYISAMCRLDYTIAEAGGTSEFVRKFTLASGGPYCDCGYRKKNTK